MEIKQGDKVRVSKDAPKMYFRGCDIIFKGNDCNVLDVEDDNAIIAYGPNTKAIPTKYLVKVDAEAKEAKYHKDDKVCINKSSLKHGLRGEILTIIEVDVSDRTYYVQSRCMRSPIWLREDEISPYTEPTEQTEAENQAFAVGERVVTPYGYGVIGKDFKGNATVILERGECCGIDKAIKPIADNPTFDWDAYTADLAKELAIAYGKRGKSPLDAVVAAKEITKRLKQK